MRKVIRLHGGSVAVIAASFAIDAGKLFAQDGRTGVIEFTAAIFHNKRLRVSFVVDRLATGHHVLAVVGVALVIAFNSRFTSGTIRDTRCNFRLLLWSEFGQRSLFTGLGN